jgi:hypothetical protein
MNVLGHESSSAAMSTLGSRTTTHRPGLGEPLLFDEKLERPIGSTNRANCSDVAAKL